MVERASVPDILGMYSWPYAPLLLTYICSTLLITKLYIFPIKKGSASVHFLRHPLLFITLLLLLAVSLKETWFFNWSYLVIISHNTVMCVLQVSYYVKNIKSKKISYLNIITSSIIVILSLAVTTFFVEKIIKLVRHQKTYNVYEESVVNIWRNDRYLPKTLKSSVASERRSPDGRMILIKTNSKGLRDTENLLYKGPNILVLGDSFSFGWGVSNGETFSDFLEATLKMNVLNAGYRSEYSMDTQYLYLTKEGFNLKPNIVLLALFAFNDFDEMRRNSHIYKDGLLDRIIAKHTYLKDGIPRSGGEIFTISEEFILFLKEQKVSSELLERVKSFQNEVFVSREDLFMVLNQKSSISQREKEIAFKYIHERRLKSKESAKRGILWNILWTNKSLEYPILRNSHLWLLLRGKLRQLFPIKSYVITEHTLVGIRLLDDILAKDLKPYLNREFETQRELLYVLRHLKLTPVQTDLIIEHALVLGIPQYYRSQLYEKVYTRHFQEVFDEGLQYIKQMSEQCKKRGIRLVVMYVPAKFEMIGKNVFSQGRIALNGADARRGQLRYSINKPRRLLRKYALKEHIPFLDLTESAMLKENASKAYFKNDHHWTVEGHKIVAQELEKFLIRYGLVQLN